MIEGGSSGAIQRLISARPEVALHLTSSPGLQDFDTADLRAGDLLAFVGAGDIDRAAREWLRGWSGFSEHAGSGWSATSGRVELRDWDRLAADPNRPSLP